MTLFQWQDYCEQMAEIVKLFQPRERGKGTPGTGGDSVGELSTADKRKLLEKAKQAGIKLPKKGI